MHPEVLQSERYPEITLTLTRISGHVVQQGESQVRLQSVLRLQEKEHPVMLDIKVQPAGDGLHATTQLVVPYVAWGLKRPSNVFLHVSDTVDVSIVANGTLSSAASERR